MQTQSSAFGRRAQPHRIILARGERVRALTLPHWAGWACATGLCAALVWLIGATAYIAFHDEILEAAREHRVTVERAYEDRIASLRRQIDEINTRQYLDQQAFESRLETVLRRQQELEERQRQIAALIEAARQRKVTLAVPSATQTTAELADDSIISPFVTSYRQDRPAPLDTSPPSRRAVAAPIAPSRPLLAATALEGGPMAAIEASMNHVDAVQGDIVSTLTTSVETLNSRLEQVMDSVGSRRGSPVADPGMGGPLVELRGSAVREAPEMGLRRLEAGLDRLDKLRFQVSRLPVRLPVPGEAEITSGYGTRLDPFLGRPALHTGVDFRGEPGDPVLAAAGGTVEIAEYSGGYGNMVEIDHGNGYSTRYSHLSSILVTAGDNVAPGDIVGRVGSTGRSTGPHLHFETRLLGTVRDPMNYLAAAELLPPGF